MKKKRSKPIRLPKIKGLNYPRWVYKLSGFLDERKGLIISEGGKYKSEFIEEKQKIFGEHASKVWGLTAEATQHLREKRIHEMAALTEVTANFEALDNFKYKLSGNTVKEKRNNRKTERGKKSLTASKRELEKNISVIDSKIALAELQTEESLLSTRRKMETVIIMYLRGAKKIPDKNFIEIGSDEASIEYYRHYLTPFISERS